MLKEIMLEEGIRELVSVRGWDCLLAIRDPLYTELTVEVFPLFEAIPTFDGF